MEASKKKLERDFFFDAFLFHDWVFGFYSLHKFTG
jgi:hypothetical protein